MLRLTWIEFLFRTIPEIFILIWGIHVIAKKSINIRQYVCSSIIIATLSFFVRWLPIYFGVHMIINLILMISIMVVININIVRAIYGTLLIYFILSLSEFFNIVILNFLNININIDVLTPITKCIIGVPSLIMLVLLILLIKYLLKMKEGIGSVSN
jgi:hypothetical protein